MSFANMQPGIPPDMRHFSQSARGDHEGLSFLTLLEPSRYRLATLFLSSGKKMWESVCLVKLRSSLDAMQEGIAALNVLGRF